MQESPPQDLVAYVPETRFPRMRRTSISAQEGLKGFARAITGGMEELRNMLRRTPLTGKLLSMVCQVSVPFLLILLELSSC